MIFDSLWKHGDYKLLFRIQSECVVFVTWKFTCAKKVLNHKLTINLYFLNNFLILKISDISISYHVSKFSQLFSTESYCSIKLCSVLIWDSLVSFIRCNSFSQIHDVSSLLKKMTGTKSTGSGNILAPHTDRI